MTTRRLRVLGTAVLSVAAFATSSAMASAACQDNGTNMECISADGQGRLIGSVIMRAGKFGSWYTVKVIRDDYAAERTIAQDRPLIPEVFTWGPIPRTSTPIGVPGHDYRTCVTFSGTLAVRCSPRFYLA